MNDRNDLQTLTEAFTELERRADAAAARSRDVPASAVRAPHRTRVPLIAASAAAVVVVAGGSAWLAGSNSGHSHGTRAGAAAPVSAPASQGAGPAASPSAPSPAPSPSAVTTSSAAPPRGLSTTASNLGGRLNAILLTMLGNGAFGTVVAGPSSALAEVTPPYSSPAPGASVPAPPMPSAATSPAGSGPGGVAIFGVLTVHGHSGGYDLQWLANTPGAKAQCDDPDRSTCTITRLPDGSSLAQGSERLQNSATGVTYQVDLIRPDGTEFLMHVSNEGDPKGESTILSPKPPLTLTQMVALVTSPLWGKAN